MLTLQPVFRHISRCAPGMLCADVEGLNHAWSMVVARAGRDMGV